MATLLETAQAYLDRAKASGLMTERNKGAFLAVAEMIRCPRTTEQVRAQIAKGCSDLVRYDGPHHKKDSD